MAKVPTTEAEPAKNALPRWRGFNMLSFFQAFSRQAGRRDGAVPENELRWIRDWGFDFLRIPMDYCRVMTRAVKKMPPRCLLWVGQSGA